MEIKAKDKVEVEIEDGDEIPNSLEEEEDTSDDDDYGEAKYKQMSSCFDEQREAFNEWKDQIPEGEELNEFSYEENCRVFILYRGTLNEGFYQDELNLHAIVFFLETHDFDAVNLLCDFTGFEYLDDFPEHAINKHDNHGDVCRGGVSREELENDEDAYEKYSFWDPELY